MRETIVVARAIQAKRFQANTKVRYNAWLPSRQLLTCCKIDDFCSELLKASVNEMGLSACAHGKVLRIAR